MPILVVDVGTSGIRTAIVDDALVVTDVHHAELLPSSPADGIVELDAAQLAASTLGLARAMLADHGPVDGVAITNQRATTVVWDADTGVPVGPALGWQDLRTVGRCLELRGDGIRLAPNQSATKIEWLVVNHGRERAGRLCAGTLDTWLAWCLSDGSLHVTDATNAGVTGMCDPAVTDWDTGVVDALGLSDVALPTIADSRRETSASPRRFPEHRRSSRSWVTNSRHSSVRAASSRARRRSPSAPEACSTSPRAQTRRGTRFAIRRGRSRSSRGATGATPCGVSKR
jgi:glycerol kinase